LVSCEQTSVTPTGRILRTHEGNNASLFPVLTFSGVSFGAQISAQDWVHTGTNLGNERIRLAAADFKPVGNDPRRAAEGVFDSTLYNDLTNAGIFDMVSKSLAPQSTPGSPQEFTGDQWSAAPASAAMVAFGALSATTAGWWCTDG
jgi:TolB protein